MLGVFSVLCLLAHLASAQYDYADVLGRSIWFFEAQQSGRLPDWNRVDWRGDSATGDGNDVGLDLTGGWYDAGDHVKFGLPHASSVTLLAWSLLEFRSGYEAAGEYNNMINSLRFPLEYFIRAHPATNTFYAQVGDGGPDHAFWGRPEDMTMARPAYANNANCPGSDVAGETAAAMAASYLVWPDSDGGFKNQLLDHARRLFDFAYEHQGVYTGCVPAGGFYGSSGYTDELGFAAAWLFKITGESRYQSIVEQYYNSGPAWAVSWDNKFACMQAIYADQGGSGSWAHVQQFLNTWRPGGGITYTPGGLAWRDMWGPNRYSGNTAFIAMIAAKHGQDTSGNLAWAKGQIDYMLGSNPRSSSYVVGFGNNPPQRPHHRSSSCHPDHSVACSWDDFNNPGPNPSTLHGALVGGPDSNDQYEDDRADYVANEVADDYNAGFQGALAGLVEMIQMKE